MSLKQIKDILDSRQVTATDAEIKAVIRQGKFNLNSLSEENVIEVIETLARAKSAITQKAVSKLYSQTEEIKGKVNGNGNRFKSEVDKDISAILQPLESYADKLENHTVNQVNERLSNIPVNILRGIAETSQEYESNPEFFRKTSEELCTALFADFTAE